MNFFRLIDNKNPYLFILFGALIALNLRFNAPQLHIFSLVLFIGVCYQGLSTPWGLLLCAIPALFGLEPAPSELGLGELILAFLLFFYVAGTYIQEYLANAKLFDRVFFVGHLILLLIICASCVHSITHGILFKEWLRAVVPFLVIYLIVPISLTVKNQFEFKAKWIFIAFSILAIELSVYINFIFFYEKYYSMYWLKSLDGEKIYDYINLDVSSLLGPFRKRITLALNQATSELLPVSLVCFATVAVFTRNRKIQLLLIFAMLSSLFAILETYTRSMLLSSILVLFLLGILSLMLGSKLFKEYIKVLSVIGFSAFIFVQSSGMGDIWIGRMNTLFKFSASSGIENHSISSMNAIENHSISSTYAYAPDENVLIRLREYKIAFDLYKEHVLIGAGLGVKHQISFQTSEGHYLHHNVGYVHSWIMYWLMVGGIIGLIFYMFFLLGPLILLYKIKSQFTLVKVIVPSTLMTMAIYASFFAVFRLISFNLILATCCGITLYLIKSHKSLNIGLVND